MKIDLNFLIIIISYLLKARNFFVFPQKHFNANCRTNVISLAAIPSYKGYSQEAHQRFTRSTEYIFSLFVYSSFPSPLTLSTLIYFYQEDKRDRDNSPPETNQHTYTDYSSVHAQVNLHLKSYSHLCTVQVFLWKSITKACIGKARKVCGVTRSDLDHSAALPLFRSHPERAAKSLSKAEHTGLWLHPPALLQPNKYQLSLKGTPHYATGTQTPGHLQHRLRSCKHGLLFLPL